MYVFSFAFALTLTALIAAAKGGTGHRRGKTHNERGEATAQVHFSVNGQDFSNIPTVCLDQCGVLSDFAAPCQWFSPSNNAQSPMAALSWARFAARALSPSGSSTQTDCINSICSSSTLTAFAGCLNCLVANGEPNLTAAGANTLLSSVASVCNIFGVSLTMRDTVTATPTTTGPFTGINLATATSDPAVSAVSSGGTSVFGSSAQSTQTVKGPTSSSAADRAKGGDWLSAGALAGLGLARMVLLAR